MSSGGSKSKRGESSKGSNKGNNGKSSTTRWGSCSRGPRGVGCGQAHSAGSCGHYGCLAPGSKHWGAPVGPRGCAHVVLPLMGAWPSMVWGRTRRQCVATGGQGGHSGTAGTAGSCGHYGCLAPPNGCAHMVLPLLTATSGAHQTQMVVCGHQGAGGTQECCWLLGAPWVVSPTCQALGCPNGT